MKVRLNPAQVRNLRNWPEAQWPAKTVVVVLDGRGANPGRVIGAVRALAVRHEALRSRLCRTVDGELVQEVTDAVRFDLRYEPATSDVLHDREPLDPFDGAFRCTLFTADEQVRSIKLCVSHFFSDGVGVEVVAEELSALLDGEVLTPGPMQASSYAVAADDREPVENTLVWKGLLDGMPRSCTYAPIRRGASEERHVASRSFDGDLANRVSRLCEELRTTPYVLWVAVGSALVSALTGQHRQVYRSTYANRNNAADLGAVAQLAQAVFVPIEGHASDTLRQRLSTVSRTSWETYECGVYDAHDLIAWLNRPESAAAFQPAFEVNYLPPSAMSPNVVRAPLPRTRVTTVAFDPAVPRADLGIDVGHYPDLVLELAAGRGLLETSEVGTLLTELLTVLDCFLEDVSTPIADLPITPLPATTRLLHDHPSGIGVDLAIAEDLIRAVPGVVDVSLTVRTAPVTGMTELAAEVVTTEVSTVAAVRSGIRSLQPWYAGSVVPDHLTVTSTGTG